MNLISGYLKALPFSIKAIIQGLNGSSNGSKNDDNLVENLLDRIRGGEDGILTAFQAIFYEANKNLLKRE